MMEFIYPRRITISRPNQNASIGTLPYQGVLESDETVLFTDIPASIQKKSGSRKSVAGLPSDAIQTSVWDIYVFLPWLPKDSIRNNDIVIDDAGSRYQVFANDWDSLGYNMTAERLEN
jgi:hypothetical protein